MTEQLGPLLHVLLMGGLGVLAGIDKSGSEVCGGGPFKEAGSATGTGTETFLNLARICCLVTRVTSTRVTTESLCKGIFERIWVWVRLRLTGAIATHTAQMRQSGLD